MSGQIIDATIVAASKQRNTIEEKKGDQGGAGSRWMRAEPGTARPKGPGCALDGQIYKSQAERGWIASAGRSRHPRVWLQEPYRCGPGLWSDPQVDGATRCHPRRRPSRGYSGSVEHGERGLGGHGIPLGEKRDDVVASWVRISHSSKEAKG